MSSPKNGEVPGLRPPTPEEVALLSVLLSSSFPGREALARQATDLVVRPLDTDGSLELKPNRGPSANVQRRIPVEGELDDADGVTVHVLLHVLDGYLAELEVYREDSRSVVRAIKPEALRLLVP